VLYQALVPDSWQNDVLSLPFPGGFSLFGVSFLISVPCVDIINLLPR